MAYEGVKIRELVERAVAHTWSIPEFQRGFVWKSTQVRDLLESLWLDYPIGSLLVWNSGGPVEEQHAHDSQRLERVACCLTQRCTVCRTPRKATSLASSVLVGALT